MFDDQCDGATTLKRFESEGKWCCTCSWLHEFSFKQNKLNWILRWPVGRTVEFWKLWKLYTFFMSMFDLAHENTWCYCDAAASVSSLNWYSAYLIGEWLGSWVPHDHTKPCLRGGLWISNHRMNLGSLNPSCLERIWKLAPNCIVQPVLSPAMVADHETDAHFWSNKLQDLNLDLWETFTVL